ncbi:MAG: hypothetical protein COU31_00355 [Candidatus Magasanikbacteria bacterium CG10_big_fil_rev_8_21_14_0_10_40_10]|uniref:Uncharacterized protein n=1 Tax=Candidatus Magasanikbacteria bacterium CG10_big_fil_rev_8_21_14_0_10_40_10 TaxID=1974648 RepID=A0A2M6W546_9BACT|nr:MAG: hypothetical protein COU31_00355 [Candidatus Magasanikbacteria bacterium CG10_big_fil_rev_8_21_14_0_10_40_10]
MHIFIGLLIVVTGVVLIMKAEWFLQNFGASAWAEAKLGTSGGTRLMYKLIGIVFIFFGMMIATSLIGGFLNATVVKLFVK